MLWHWDIHTQYLEDSSFGLEMHGNFANSIVTTPGTTQLVVVSVPALPF